MLCADGAAVYENALASVILGCDADGMLAGDNTIGILKRQVNAFFTKRSNSSWYLFLPVRLSTTSPPSSTASVSVPAVVVSCVVPSFGVSMVVHDAEEPGAPSVDAVVSIVGLPHESIAII